MGRNFDDAGAAVGGTGHDAAAIVAALIAAGHVTSVDEAGEAFSTLHAKCFDSYVRTKGAEGVAEVFSQPSERRPARGGGQRRGGNDDGEPGSAVIKSGKHAGKTIAAVHAEDPQWIEWAADNLKNEWLRTRIATYLASQS